LVDGIPPQERTSPVLECFPSKGVPLLFVTVSNDEEFLGTSCSNSAEANVVRNVIHMMLNGGIDEGDIGVISPYRAQVLKLRGMFPQLRFPRLKIASVDSFQGSERDYIIISCVRSKNKIGFVADERRLNVSITRARRGLVIIGNSETLARCSAKWSDLVQYFQMKTTVQNEIRGTELIARPDPDNDPGIELQTIESRISGQSVRIVWPEADLDPDSKALTDWVERRCEVLTEGKFITIALDTESEGNLPLCIQLGEIVVTDFDPFDEAASWADSPQLGITDGIIVFCRKKDGSSNHELIRRLLSPLLQDPGIAIATYDCTMDLMNLELIGIEYLKDRVIDCQVYGLPTGIDYLTYTKVNSLGHRIETIDVECTLLAKAHEYVQGDKQFPWDANAFLMEHDNLPLSSMITRAFLEYSANDIPLTALTFIDVVEHGDIRAVKQASDAKLTEFTTAQQRYGPKGGYMTRQSIFRQKNWSLFSPRHCENLPTTIILDEWRKLRDVIEIAKYQNGELFTLDVRPNILQQRLEQTKAVLAQKERLSEVRYIAKLVVPPSPSTPPNQ
jgi:hypothetical protein